MKVVYFMTEKCANVLKGRAVRLDVIDKKSLLRGISQSSLASACQ